MQDSDHRGLIEWNVINYQLRSIKKSLEHIEVDRQYTFLVSCYTTSAWGEVQYVSGSAGVFASSILLIYLQHKKWIESLYWSIHYSTVDSTDLPNQGIQVHEGTVKVRSPLGPADSGTRCPRGVPWVASGGICGV